MREDYVTATRAEPRRLRLLPMTSLPVSLRPRRVKFAAAGWLTGPGRVSRQGRGARPCPRRCARQGGAVACVRRRARFSATSARFQPAGQANSLITAGSNARALPGRVLPGGSRAADEPEVTPCIIGLPFAFVITSQCGGPGGHTRGCPY